MRLFFDVDFDKNAGSPYFEAESTLIDSVQITQFDEPVDRIVESFPYEQYAQLEQLQSA